MYTTALKHENAIWIIDYVMGHFAVIFWIVKIIHTISTQDQASCSHVNRELTMWDSNATTTAIQNKMNNESRVY
jgi:hypothetical protein